MENLHQAYFKIQESFSKGELEFNDYCDQIINWNKDFETLIKSNITTDGSRGGKLVKKKIVDKTGKQVTKWVKSNSNEPEKKKRSKEDSEERRQREIEIPDHEWEKAVEGASEKALKRASKFASSERVRKIARNELFKRSFNLKKFLDMSLMPDFMLDDYVDRYQGMSELLTEEEREAISEYRDNAFFRVNKKIREGEEMDEEEKKIRDKVQEAISKSELINDIVLYRGLNSKNSLLFINYLKTLESGDIYEEASFSSTSLLQGTSQKFKDLYSSANNITLKIFASKGQKALCMQNLGTESDQEMYQDEYEFLLPLKSKFQVIERDGDTISVKLLD